MSSTEPEQQGSRDYMDAAEMLSHGQRLAFQLRDLLLDDKQIPVSGERLVLAEDLLHRIHGSFTNTISALDLRHSAGSPGQMAESNETSLRPRPRSAPASRRRRREITESQSWTEESSTLVHDGHAWRKYGQKPILDAKHSRSYFKCTHKDQYGCPAKKHVQQIRDDPLTYRTIYTFSHTCTNMISNAALDAPAASQMLDLGSTSAAQSADMNHTSSSTMILNFQSNQHHSDHNHNALMKQEYTTLSDQTTEDHHLASFQQMTSSNNNNLGSSSDVGGEMPHNMGNFMNYSTDYSPYSSFLPDEDRWFD